MQRFILQEMPPKIEKKLIQRISAEGELQLIILFGSMARREENGESDIDLAVRFQKQMTAEQRMRLIGEIALISGRPVDLVDLTTVGEPLLGKILHTGKRLYGSDRDYLQPQPGGELGGEDLAENRAHTAERDPDMGVLNLLPQSALL